MNHRDQILRFSRTTAGLIRVAKRSCQPDDLMQRITGRVDRLWQYGCHSFESTQQDRETARRCTTALLAMFRT